MLQAVDSSIKPDPCKIHLARTGDDGRNQAGTLNGVEDSALLRPSPRQQNSESVNRASVRRAD